MTSSHGRSGISIFTFYFAMPIVPQPLRNFVPQGWCALQGSLKFLITYYFFPCRGYFIIHFIRRHFIHLLLACTFFLDILCGGLCGKTYKTYKMYNKWCGGWIKCCKRLIFFVLLLKKAVFWRNRTVRNCCGLSHFWCFLGGFVKHRGIRMLRKCIKCITYNCIIEYAELRKKKSSLKNITN